jgi:hypothetical protein
MRKLGLLDVILGLILVFFVINVWGWWNKGNVVQENTTMIIALATIIYALFTAFIFLNMKSSSETQVRPLLITSLSDDMELIITNKLRGNVAKNIKVKIRIIPLKRYYHESKRGKLVPRFFHREWTFVWDDLKSHKEELEIIDNLDKVGLSSYIVKNLKLKGIEDYSQLVQKGKSKEKLDFRVKLKITYESLLDIGYDLGESYWVHVDKQGTDILKIGEP